MTGKSKKGGIWVDEDDVVCTLVARASTDSLRVNVIAGIRGRLIEFNDRLVDTSPQVDLSVIERKVGKGIMNGFRHRVQLRDILQLFNQKRMIWSILLIT